MSQYVLKKIANIVVTDYPVSSIVMCIDGENYDFFNGLLIRTQHKRHLTGHTCHVDPYKCVYVHCTDLCPT